MEEALRSAGVTLTLVCVPVGDPRDSGAVCVHGADAGLHALVHLPPQPACCCLGHLQVGSAVLQTLKKRESGRQSLPSPPELVTCTEPLGFKPGSAQPGSATLTCRLLLSPCVLSGPQLGPKVKNCLIGS